MAKSHPANLKPATALAHPNIAFIKYWGNRDDALRLPLTGSISMNLSGLETITTVVPDRRLKADRLTLGGVSQTGAAFERVSRFLDQVRRLANSVVFARVTSANNFPAGAGIASSASAFAALALAASKAYALDLPEASLSSLARLGSGSASRSIPDGFVEWKPGETHAESYAWSIAPPEHWELVDLIVILDQTHKITGSSDGHKLAHTSPLNAERIAAVPGRLDVCRQAILQCDFQALAEVTEADSEHMHAVMRTSTPSLIYQTKLTLDILAQVKSWRDQGCAVCATVDAGPNVHVIAEKKDAQKALSRLRQIEGVLDVLVSAPSPGARLI